MKRIISWLVPREKRFFGMLAEQSGNVLGAARELSAFIDGYSKLERSLRTEKVLSIKKISEKIDGLGSEMLRKLNKSSAPDKEDIHKVVLLLGETAGLISDCALRFVILSIERIDNYMLKLADILQHSAEELDKAMLDSKKPNNMKSHCERIQSLRNEAEEIYNKALSELFHFYKNSIDIMKYREVYELLRAAIKKCKAAAELVDGIVARHS